MAHLDSQSTANNLRSGPLLSVQILTNSGHVLLAQVAHSFF